MAARSAIVWFKSTDLRVADHEALVAAHRSFTSVLHVFVFDPAAFGRSRVGGFPRVGAHRARFLLESVAGLRQSLRSRGSTLVVRCGDTATTLARLVADSRAAAVFAHSEACTEELETEARVRRALAALPGRVPLQTLWGGATMYHVDDLAGLDVRTALPPVFTHFRKHAETKGRLRAPLPPPSELRPSPPFAPVPSSSAASGVDFPLGSVRVPPTANEGDGVLPSLAALGAADLAPLLAAATEGTSGGGTPPSTSVLPVAPPAATVADSDVLRGGLWASGAPADPRAVLRFVGGEAAALARLRAFVWGDTATGGGARAPLRTYKETRNGLVGAAYSSKLSPWLAVGCLSPRTVRAEVAAHEAVHGANDSTYWVLFELLWRDYMRFSALRFGPRVFHRRGPRGAAPDASRPWRADPALRAAWCAGRTGYPFVDANMRELLATGFMSNRGRQNVASFLARDARIDWRVGAEWFEALLLDSDAASNFGNWAYVAGVGADPREDRYFLIPKQARTYDSGGDYCRLWVPEVADAPTAALHDPRGLPRQLLLQPVGAGGGGGGGGGAAQAQAARGGRYPQPVVRLLAWDGEPAASAGGGAAPARHGGDRRRPTPGSRR